MKGAVISLLLAAISNPVEAQPAVNSIAVKGSGSWELLCHVKGRMGDDMPMFLSNARSTFAGADFSSVSCDTTAAARGPLIVSVSGPNAVCPFKGAATGSCEQTFKGGAASFTVHTK